MFTIPSVHVCFQKGDRMPLASQPGYLIARQLVPGLDLVAGNSWERVVFRNGAHRWVAANAIAPFPAGCAVERLMDFDETIGVGHVAGFTDWNPKDHQQVGPLVALARLCSVRSGSDHVHQGQQYTVQQWCTLAVLGGSRV